MGKGMYFRGLLGTIARVEYSIPVSEFYLVLHDLLNIKNEKLTLNLSINITKLSLSLMRQLTNKACSLVKYGMFETYTSYLCIFGSVSILLIPFIDDLHNLLTLL